MSTAFLHGASGVPGIPNTELERITSDWSWANETTVTPDHEGRCIYVVITGPDNSGIVKGGFYIDDTRVEETQYDFIVRDMGTSPCGVLFILCVKHGSAYDLCSLDGSVVRAGAENFKIRNYSHGIYVSALKVTE